MSERGGPRAGARAVQSIWIGPGDRLRPLIHVLAGLGVAVRDIGDLSETATATSADDIEIVLDADEIPLEARILAVADAYEAMIAQRPYRTGMPASEARAELLRGAGTQFDPDVVEAFLRTLAAAPAVAAAS